MISIRYWLEANDLGQYVDTFEREQIDLDSVRELTDTDIKDLGLPIGHRSRLRAAIQALRESQSEPANADAESRHLTHAASTSGERRQLTVMFCDLVGSTALSERLDPEELRALFHTYRTRCGDVVERYEGHIARYVGDGILSYFGWPTAHEDDGERSVRAALEIVDAIKSSSALAQLSVRIGVATGPVVVGDKAGEGAESTLAVGSTPNLAARLQGLAGPDEIVIADSTKRLVANTFEVVDLGLTSLKGFSEPEHPWRVQSLAGRTDRFDAKHAAGGSSALVGREEEVGLLLRRWEQAKSGEGQVVLLSGEPGIGKSKIVEVLRERLAPERHTCFRYQCSPFHANSALFPLIEQLERYAGFARDDSAEQKLDKLESLFSTNHEATEQVALIAALLSLPTERYPALQLSPKEQKERTIAALVQQIVDASNKEPLLFLFEDLHWADPTTQETLAKLFQRIESTRLLAVLTTRPEVSPDWVGQSGVTALTLSRLSRREVAALAMETASGKPLPPPVMDHILAKTDGVPLFVEELTKAIIESGLLRSMEDRYQLEGPLSSVAIPSTLRDSLTARLDRLGEVKGVAQIGAVIGRQFSYELLAAVSPMKPAELDGALDRLVHSELVQQVGTPPQAIYVFKHALVQDAAYESLLKQRKLELHKRIAEVLEAHLVIRKSEVEPEIIAHHYTGANIPDKAAAYWLRAGKEAAARYANREAIAHFAHGLELLPLHAPSRERDKRELELLLALGEAQLRTGQSTKATRTFERAALCAKALSLPEALARAAVGCEEATFRPASTNKTAIGLLQEALAVLDESDSVLRVRVLGALVRGFIHMGRFDDARPLRDEAMAMAERIGLDDFNVLTAVLSATASEIFGRWEPDRLAAIRPILQRGVRHPSRISDKAQFLYFCITNWMVTTWSGDARSVDPEQDDLMRIAGEFDDPFFLSFGHQRAAAMALFEGRFVECEALAGIAFETAQRITGVDAAGILGVYMFSLRRDQGRLQEVAPLVEHFVQSASEEETWRPGLMLIYADLGMLDMARKEFNNLAGNNFAAIADDGNWLNCMRMLAEVCCILDDRLRAEQLYRLLEPYANCNVCAAPLTAVYGVGGLYLGMLATTLARWDDAEAHFVSAIELNGKQGGRPWVARAQFAYADMLLRRGNSGDAQTAGDLLQQAHATATELGMAELVQRTEQAKQSLALSPG